MKLMRNPRKTKKMLRTLAVFSFSLLVILYLILPVALERFDGTIQPSERLPVSLILKGGPTLPTQFLHRPNGTIAFDDTGTTGPLVVQVPGMGDLRQEYRFLTPQLVAAGFRVVTMDIRGHGESSVDWPDYSAAAVGSDIDALVRNLNAGPAFIIGTSMAAGSAVWAAAEAPDLIAGQVLIGPVTRDLPSSFVDNLAIKVGIAGPWGVAAWSMFYKSLYPTLPPADLSAYRGALKANLREPRRFAALQRMLAASKADCEARLDAAKAPTLVVMGTKDPDFKSPEAEATWLTQRLQGTLVMVQDAGHYPHAEMPMQVGPQIIAFLREHRKGA
jgi:pimeloyl-ACP methyl ester carboxylesterase